MESATGQDVKDQVQEKAQEATEQVREKADEAREQVRGRLQQELDRRSTQAGEEVESIAETLRRVAQSLREEGKDGPAQFAERAAERAERAGRWLRDSDADRILGDIERFGRERPWAFAIGGLAIGLAAARMMKASSGQRYRSETGRSHGGNGHRPNGFAELPPTGPTEGQTGTGAPATRPDQPDSPASRPGV